MSDYILLTDKNQCPGCRCRRSFVSGNCHNCGVRLFTSPDFDMNRFEEETAMRYWWAYHQTNGWMSRDHFMIEGAKPNKRIYELPHIPKDYGRQTTPGQVAAQTAKSTRVRRAR